MVTNEPRPCEPEQDEPTRPAGFDAVVDRRLAPDTAELAPLRSWLDRQLAPLLGYEQRELLLVVVTEAATNAIEAHRREATDLPIVVTVDQPGRVVSIEDHGGGLASERVDGLVPPQPSAPRGRGLLIIRSICPDARFIGTGTGTRVELPFQI